MGTVALFLIKDLQGVINPTIKGERARIVGYHLHNIRKNSPVFFRKLWGHFMPHQFNKKDFWGVANRTQRFLEFRNNQNNAQFYGIEDPSLKLWIQEFSMVDADQPGSPSLEGYPALYHWESEKYGGKFYPPSIMRPTHKGNGDYLILTNSRGWVKYDLKSHKIFFTPNEKVAIGEVKAMVKGLRGKNCELIIDGSLQPLEKVKELREYLLRSGDPQLSSLKVVHPE